MAEEISELEQCRINIKVLEKIGEGASSKVYGAIKRQFDDLQKGKVKHCAVKLVCLDSPKRLQNYENEKRAHYVLGHHENILYLRSLCSLTISNTKYGVFEMERMDTDLISIIIEKGAIHENTARFIFQQVCKAILYCHSHFLYHLDIKADNILLNYNKFGEITSVKVCDFGCARIARTPSEFSFGTPEYLPLESYTHKYPIKPEKADIWSLGVLLFVMVTGTYPFRYDCEKMCYECIGLSMVNQFCDDRRCLTLIRKMLSENPYERPSISQVENDPWLQ